MIGSPKAKLAITLLLGFVAVALASPATAQKLSRTYYEDGENGYRFRTLDGWENVPPLDRERNFGVTCKMEGDTRVTTVNGQPFQSRPDLMVLRLAEDSGIGEMIGGSGRPSLRDIISVFFGTLRNIDVDDPIVDKEIKASKKLKGRQQRWTAFSGSMDIYLDTYTYELEDATVCLVFTVPEDYAKKWLKMFEKVGRSMEPMERSAAVHFEEGGTYKDVLRYHEQITSRTPGWRVVPTPSEQFVIKTSSDDDRFIDEVIERLELSRKLFEKDFPPSTPIEDVSVVRVCKSPEEFRSYSGAGPGTAGLFDPSSIELILYDNKAQDRNATYAVMTHEAFHQYCHFLFEQSEAHRWFDEGHGDYYGGVEFKRGRAKVTPKMPGGLNRYDHAKELVRTGDYKPLAEHLNSSHREWQNQGPINVSSYCQSWSVIYYLRQGTEGNISRKMWKKEYAEIIPNYVSTLYAGFKEAYAEILAELEAEAKEEGRELTPDEREISRLNLGSRRKEKIWEAAMDASFGQVDLDAFEEDWKTYVLKGL